MKKIIIVLLVLLTLLITSCVQPTEAIVETSVVTNVQTSIVTDTQVTTKIVPTTVTNTVTVIKVVDPISGNEYTIQQGQVGVANAEVTANGYYNGYSAHWIGLVLNGEDTQNQFNISVTPYTNADYNITQTPPNVSDWVTITNANLTGGVLTVSPDSAASLYITLNVPVGVQLPPQWGFVVHVVQASSGNIVADDSIRWLVYMQQPS